MKLLEATLASTPVGRPIPTDERPQHLCLDRGYDYRTVRLALDAQRLIAHIRARGEEIDLKRRRPDWRARRWIVESTHSWMNRNRSILIRWSKKPENHLAMLHLAAGLIALKKAHAAALQG